MNPEVKILRCECGLPFAKIQNGVILIKSKHHGETHTNGIALTEVQALLMGVERFFEGEAEDD